MTPPVLLLAFALATSDVAFKLLDGEALIPDGHVRRRD